MIQLTPTIAVPFAVERGWLRPDEPATAVALAGGVSCEVIALQTPSRRLIVKQALPAWRVNPPWPCRLDRAIRERECIEALGRIVPPGVIPRVLAYDDAHFCFLMSAFPVGALTWKSHLLAGRIDPAVARQAGALLGEIHRATWGGKGVPAHFADTAIFEQMRIAAYYRAIAAAHPRIAAIAERCGRALLAAPIALVHGDYAPKNILIVDGAIRLLDFETAHLGQPLFDVAFCLSHLALKAIRFPIRRVQYLDLAAVFVDAYLDACGRLARALLDRELVLQLGCLLLARIDGRSPVEYIVDEPTRDQVRQLAIALLMDPGTLDEALTLVERASAACEPFAPVPSG